ncbi:Aste57867_752 [Aphanomyces stellatus]|uniref:Aste57867_752 protein n=1 Tax=Aphanomyces stellatus TaxID=120398 RepID=A0A485K8P5_9STRA|nr:hypothetical protein As57867_000751 [Aphanomyces stellatus]VFT77976.1 Aste57867_752 [Aphanomyces stellatus]
MVLLVTLASALAVAAARLSGDVIFDETVVFPDVITNDDTERAAAALPPSNLALDVLLPVDTSVVDLSTKPCVVTLARNYSFGASYGKPYQGAYTAPACVSDPDYSLAYLRFSANVDAGRQFDRIAAVWVDGLELLRSTTQEPSAKIGPKWEIFKDVSHYRNIFAKGGNATVALDNVITDLYTSYFHVTVTVEFYKQADDATVVQRVPGVPDHVIAISNKKDTYPWFSVQPNTAGKNFNLVTLPRNLDGLFLELFISHHGCDEFHYGNPPDQYKAAVGADCGGGAFREIQVSIDGDVVAAVWPFPLIYTGGLSPALWRPVVATGGFEAPTYVLDLTPYLAKVVDGKAHNFSFGIDYGLDYWPTTGNLLVYLDQNTDPTEATIDTFDFAAHATPSVTVGGTSPDLTIHTSTARKVAVSSTITNSQGTRHYTLEQTFGYENHQVYSNKGNNQLFKQHTTTQTTTTIEFEDGTQTTKYFSEDYPLTGVVAYQPYTFGRDSLETIVASNAQVEIPPFRAPRIHLPDAAREATEANYYKINVTISHEFHQKLQLDGNKDDFRTGVDEYEISIKQNADAKTDSRLGSNATNAVALTSSNATGCYSRNVKAGLSGPSIFYTKYTEGEKCPTGFAATRNA